MVKSFKQKLVEQSGISSMDNALQAMKAALATLPTDDRDGIAVVRASAVAPMLSSPHPGFGNLAGYLLSLLGVEAKHAILDAALDPWASFRRTLMARFHYAGEPGLLLLQTEPESVALDLSDVTVLAHPHKVLKSVYGFSPVSDDGTLDHDPTEELIEAEVRSIEEKIRDLMARRNEVIRGNQDRLRKIDDRLDRLREKRRERDQNKITSGPTYSLLVK